MNLYKMYLMMLISLSVPLIQAEDADTDENIGFVDDVRRGVRRGLDFVKEKYEDGYYEVLDRSMPLILTWQDWQEEELQYKHVLGAGLCAGAVGAAWYYKLPTVFSEFGKDLYAKTKKFTEEFYAENPKTAYTIGIAAGALALMYGTYKYLKMTDKSSNALLNEFWASMNEEQSREIQAKHLSLIVHADANPIELYDSPEFMELLTEEQQELLEKIIMQHTRESECLKEIVA